MEIATMAEGLDLIMEEVEVGPESPLAGKALRDTNVRKDLNVIVIAILRKDGDMIFNPSADTNVAVGDKIIAVGNRSGIEGLAEMAHDDEGTA
jgi:voltage-gated potassium channel